MDTQVLVSMRGVSEQAFGSRCADGLYRDFVTYPAATQAIKSLTVLRKPVETGLYLRLITVAIAVIIFTITIINVIIIQMMYMKQITLRIITLISSILLFSKSVLKFINNS